MIVLELCAGGAAMTKSEDSAKSELSSERLFIA
jgi:hypothetical protein